MRRLVIMSVLFAVISAGCSRCTQEKRTALPMPKGTPHRPVGVAAVAANPGATPPFSRDDVAAYIKAHNLPGNMGPKEALQVDGLDFITSAEASKRLQDESTGLGENEMVGFATISGGVIFSSPPPEKKAAKFERAYAVFDASNGNLLMVGTLAGRPE